MTKVISGFPGVGKSTLFKQGISCLDSDSSTFDKSDFPRNYIEHIKLNLEKDEYDYIFVSSHKVVREALVEAGIAFTLVYPDMNLKYEYLERYQDRKSPPAFLTLMMDNWESFISDCEKQLGCTKIALQEGQFLSDVLERLR